MYRWRIGEGSSGANSWGRGSSDSGSEEKENTIRPSPLDRFDVGYGQLNAPLTSLFFFLFPRGLSRRLVSLDHLPLSKFNNHVHVIHLSLSLLSHRFAAFKPHLSLKSRVQHRGVVHECVSLHASMSDFVPMYHSDTRLASAFMFSRHQTSPAFLRQSPSRFASACSRLTLLRRPVVVLPHFVIFRYFALTFRCILMLSLFRPDSFAAAVSTMLESFSTLPRFYYSFFLRSLLRESCCLNSTSRFTLFSALQVLDGT